MAGFSLGGGSGRGGQDEIPHESLFLYPGSGAVRSGNDEIPSYPRGFELWQHQVPHHQQQHQHLYSSAGLLRFSDEPVPCGVAAPVGRTGMRGGGSGSGGGGMNCQDCGNQAKKDCSHLRCRTCCKSRGFHCTTHVKSTWVPASKRRERQQQLVAAATYQQPPGRATPRGEPSKRPREIITTTTTSGGGMEALSLPSEVSSPAVFRCVRVSPMDEADDEYAYQTAVTIGGHVFKGLLYDQGPEAQYQHGDSSSSAAAAASITTTAAIAPALTSSAVATTTAAASAGLLDPSVLYPTPLSAFMASTQFFPHHPRT